jgi:hypothetical protein
MKKINKSCLFNLPKKEKITNILKNNKLKIDKSEKISLLTNYFFSSPAGEKNTFDVKYKFEELDIFLQELFDA